VEGKMLHDYGKVLIEMLTNDSAERIANNFDAILSELEIDPELKAIIYECVHARDRVMQKEQEKYES
jgi:uncharacterized protein YuzB (UPF0349 family)